jgi:hypothetical protein
MEDRLREAFEQEAERLHAPSGSPATAMRRGRRRRASNLIGGAALVVALIGGTAVGVQVLGGGADPADTAETDQTTAAELTGSTTESRTADRNEESSTPAAGEVAFDWERVTLETPEGADVWSVQVAALGDRYVAVGHGHTGSDEGGVLTWTSSDGRDWSLVDTTAIFNGSLDQVFSTADGFVAVVRSYDGLGESTLLYTSGDGLNWTEGEVDLSSTDEYTFSYFTGAASGNGATIVAGASQTEPPEPPIVFADWGVVLEPRRFDGGFDVRDLASRTLITSIDDEAVYGGEPAVYDAEGKLLFRIPWEALEDSAGAEETGGISSIDVEGYRLEMDFGSYRYTVTVEGEVIAEGDQDELYRPPRVTITDPDGTVVLDITTDELYEAQDRAWSERDDEFFPTSEPLVFVTNDGATWDRIALPTSQGDAQGIDIAGVTFGPTGFVLSVNQYGGDFYQASVLQSSNGRDWQLLGSDAEPRNGPIVARDGRFYALSYGRGPGVSVSTDGVEWSTVLDTPDRDVFYNTIAAGDFGIVVLGQRQEVNFGPPLSISKDGRTLVLDYEDGSFTVIEDATGEQLAVVAFDIWDEEAPDQIRYDEETGSITILDEAGTELMTVTEEEGEAAEAERQEQYGDLYPDQSIPSPVAAFSPDGEEWFTVSTEGLDVIWPQSIAVGDDSVVVIGESLDAYYQEQALGSYEGTRESGGGPATTVVAVDGFPGSAPSVNLWVGTRK